MQETVKGHESKAAVEILGTNAIFSNRIDA